VAEQPVGQTTVKRFAVLTQPAMLLSDPRDRVLGGVGALPVPAPRPMRALGVKAARRPGPVPTIQTPLLATQPHDVQADPISQRLHPPHLAAVASLDGDRDLAGTRSKETRPSLTRWRRGRCPSMTICMR
jgi:hypothetical protein